jgi:hypothetical protein
MAFLQEDSAFTHVIAIDFGTGASGYVHLLFYSSSISPLLSSSIYLLLLATVSRLNLLNQVKNQELKCSTHAMKVMIRRLQLLSCLMMNITSSLLETLRYLDMLRCLMMKNLECFSKLY